jgi:hypothetical protein
MTSTAKAATREETIARLVTRFGEAGGVVVAIAAVALPWLATSAWISSFILLVRALCQPNNQDNNKTTTRASGDDGTCPSSIAVSL